MLNLSRQNCQDFWINPEGVDYTQVFEVPLEGQSSISASLGAMLIVACRLGIISAESKDVRRWCERLISARQR